MGHIRAATLGAGLGLTALALTGSMHAAQLRLQAQQEQALAQLETAFPEHQIRITQLATTNRFALIYAQQANGPAVTVTLRQLPQRVEFLDLTVDTDSPHDPALERRLLQRLRQLDRDNRAD